MGGLGCVLGPEETWDEIRIIFADFVKKGMSLDPDKRPNAEKILQHSFIERDEEAVQKLLEAWDTSEKTEKPKETPAAAPVTPKKITTEASPESASPEVNESLS